MGVSLSSLASAAFAANLVTDTDADTTIEAHVTGGTGSFYLVELDNTANTGSAAYLRIKDATTATTSSIADFKFFAPASTKLTYVITEGMAFAAGLSVWCTTSAADGNAAAPGQSVIAEILSS